MRTVVALLCVSLTALGVSGAGKDKPVTKIDGAWVATSITFPDGKKVSEEQLAKIANTSTFKDGKYTVMTDGKLIDSGTYVIDATAKPATMDKKSDKEDEKGKVWLAIFKVEGEKLTIAEANAGSPRPKAFEASSVVALWIMKRTK